MDRLLEGVFLDLVPVVLDAGADFVAAAEAVLPLVADMDDDRRARLSIDLGADPLTAPLSERSAPRIGRRRRDSGEDDELRGRGAGDHGRRHRAAQSRRQRVVGAGRGGRRGRRAICGCWAMPASARRSALRQISFRLAADDDQFMTIAKFRAMRRLWARVAEVVGEPDAGAATVHAVTSMPMMAQRDPWVNMLRTTRGGVRRWRRGRGHRAGAAVRCRDSGRNARHRTRVSPAASRAIPNCCCWRSPISAGCSTRRRLLVRRGPHRAARRAGLGALPADRSTRWLRRGPRLRRRRDRGGPRPARRRHRPPPHRAHRCQRVSESR